MNIALNPRPMTQDEFFDWPGHDNGRFEFDGFQPVAMTGGTPGHSIILSNINAALRSRLKGTGCVPLGPEAGIATVGTAIRYPDALVTCSKFDQSAYVVPDPVIVFEVLSKTSAKTDLVDKVREYRAVPSILRYLVVQRTVMGASVFRRASGDDGWTESGLKAGETVELPEVGISIPLDEFYEGVELST